MSMVIEQLVTMSWQETWAVALGIAYVILSVRQNPLCWPFGIASVSLWLWVVFSGRLYMDAVLQGVYVVLGFYGWFYWLRGTQGEQPPVRRLKKAEVWPLLAIGVAASLVCGVLSTHLGADFPWWDSVTTVTSLIANYLLARKILENWLLWVAADVAYILIYAAKGYWGFSALMVVYSLMAAWGYLRWSRSLQGRPQTFADTPAYAS